MAPLATWSNAPTASTERTVARGLASVAARSGRLTASVPTRVLKPNWCGKHADWKWGAKCCARARPRRRRSTSPTTSARTRPLGFRRATRRPTRRPSRTTEGTSACASLRAAPCNRRLSSEGCVSAHWWHPRARQRNRAWRSVGTQERQVEGGGRGGQGRGEA